MINDIFTSWEWFSQYNEEQIEFLKKTTQNNRRVREETERNTTRKLVENFTKNNPEENDEYILWLA
jgi:Asp-tRNA(Asn)/Glu-tRNA(Gln) amidotransferase C subunit